LVFGVWAQAGNVEGWLRTHPIDVLRSVILIEEVHKPNDFLIGKVKEADLHSVSLHALADLIFLILNLHHRFLELLR
jgi:hypothetical protein